MDENTTGLPCYVYRTGRADCSLGGFSATHDKIHGLIRQPFRAECAKCGQTIYFDIDPGGTPGFNGDWGDGNGDFGCDVDGNGHVPTRVEYDGKLYPYPDKKKKMRYCRVVFSKSSEYPLIIDFGFYSQEQKIASIKKLREQYSDHSLTKSYAIDAPIFSQETPAKTV